MDTKHIEEEWAQIAYDVYCEAVRGVAFNGDSLPSWAEFSTDPNKIKQSNGWRAVAKRLFGKSLGDL